MKNKNLFVDKPPKNLPGNVKIRETDKQFTIVHKYTN